MNITRIIEKLDRHQSSGVVDRKKQKANIQKEVEVGDAGGLIKSFTALCTYVRPLVVLVVFVRCW